MAKKALQELNLLDNFLFGTMISHPLYGEKFSRELLKIITKKEFGKLRVIPQKIYYGSDPTKHGTRLDVYVEEDESTTIVSAEERSVYDIEVEQDQRVSSIKMLPRRVRFYHAKIDAASLNSGERYGKLKSVIVIMVMPFDPFGQNRMVYTIRTMCEERPDMAYDDGARTMFLYTKGTEGNPPEELKALLNYMEHTDKENAVNEDLCIIQQMVEQVKTEQEVSIEYMKIYEREEMLVEQGIPATVFCSIIRFISNTLDMIF